VKASEADASSACHPNKTPLAQGPVSSVVEQPFCKRQVASSILGTGHHHGGLAQWQSGGL
jgi:hypothetical protein